METTEQTINAPACFKCDDLGYTTGTEVFGVARCDCAIGVTADMRGVPSTITGILSTQGLKFDLERAKRALLSAGFEDFGGEEWKPPINLEAADLYHVLKDSKPAKPLLQRAYDLIDEARAAGQVLKIDLVPLEPLAMGHYEMVPNLRPKRERAPTVEIRQKREDTARDFSDLLMTTDLNFKERMNSSLDAYLDSYINAVLDGTGVCHQNADGSVEHVPADQLRPTKTMMYPDRRTEARKHVLKEPKAPWPVPDPDNFTLERRDPHSTLTQEQFDKRSTDRKKREGR
jgi:hypothetical protein